MAVIRGTGIPIDERNLSRFVALYSRTLDRILREFASEVSFRQPRSFSIIRSLLGRLDELDSSTERWARRNIPSIYNAAVKTTRRNLRAMGWTRAQIKEFGLISNGAALHEAAVSALVFDPDKGMVPLLRNAVGQIRGRMQSIQIQGKLFVAQRRAVNEIVASEAFLQGRSLNEVSGAITRELLSRKYGKDLKWTARARRMAPDTLLGDVANLPMVRIPLASGGERLLRVDKYAELVARTKMAQAHTTALVNECRTEGVTLMRVSNNAPLTDDLCWLYMGQVVALTQKDAKRFKVPHINSLPGGGPPFHPNCRHDLEPFVIEAATPAEIEAGIGGQAIPRGALDKSWGEASKYWKEKGGVEGLGRKNSVNIRAGQVPRELLRDRDRDRLPSWLREDVGDRRGALPRPSVSVREYSRKLKRDFGLEAEDADRIARKLRR